MDREDDPVLFGIVTNGQHFRYKDATEGTDKVMSCGVSKPSVHNVQVTALFHRDFDVSLKR